MKFSEQDIEQYKDVRDYCDANSDMPDGAFYAMAEEMEGWTTEDWVWFSDVGSEIQKLLDKKKK